MLIVDPPGLGPGKWYLSSSDLPMPVTGFRLISSISLLIPRASCGRSCARMCGHPALTSNAGLTGVKGVCRVGVGEVMLGYVTAVEGAVVGLEQPAGVGRRAQQMGTCAECGVVALSGRGRGPLPPGCVRLAADARG